jgi:hypothetical protein
MALVIANRVQETTTTTGTGTVTLAGAASGFQSFAVVGNTNTTYYTITSGTDWEVGIGTYSTTGPTLARTTILSSSNANAAITLTGTSTVFSSYPAEKVISDGYGLLPVANGGTGQSSYTDGQLLVGNTTGNTLTKTTLTAGTNVTITNGSGSITINAADQYVGTVTSVSGTGTVNGITLTGTVTTSGSLTLGGTLSGVSLTSQVTGTLPVANGGTGATTLTANGVLYGSGTSAIAATAVGTTGQVLVGNTGSAPTWSTLSGIGVTSFSAGTTGLTPSSATTGVVTLAGTLGVANGGTGTATAFTAGSVVFAGASGVYSQDNASLFWDDTNNRLGIANASPSANLTVAGTAKIGEGAASNTSKLLVNTLSGVAAGIQLFQDANESWIIQNPASTTVLTFGNSGTERMRITSTGNVGIGTSSPVEKLDVVGNAKITSGSSFYWGDATAQITATNGDAMRFLVGNGGEKVRIDSSGNVGIGTTGPSSYGKLAVIGNIATSTDGGTVLTMRANAGATTVAAYNATGSSLSFNTNANGSGELERMRITSAGDVGIGTASPTAKLTVNDANGIPVRIGDISAAPVSQTAVYVGVSTSALSGGNGDLVLIPRTSDARSVLFYTGNGTAAERMRIDSSGNVLVGTATASYSASGRGVAILGGSASGLLGFQIGGVAKGYVGHFDTSMQVWNEVASPILFGTSATERMRIDSSGNVGIGTTSVSNKLQSAYTVSASVPAAGATGHGLGVGSSGFGLAAGALNSGNAYLQATRWDGTAANYDLILQPNGGNVGIGTTSPANRLHVVGSPGTLLRLDGGAGGTGTRDIFISEFDTAAYGGIIRYDSAADLFTFGTVENSVVINAINVPRSTGNVGIGTTSPGVKLDVYSSGSTSNFIRTRNDTTQAFFEAGNGYAFLAAATNHPLILGTNNTERMRITSAGLVGIGTSSPSTILHAVASGSELRSENTSTAQYFSGRVRLKGPAGTYRSTAMVHGNGNTGGTNTYFAIEGSDSADNYLQTLALYDYTSQFWGFSTNSTERMRIDSSGNLMLGTTSSSSGFTVQRAGSDSAEIKLNQTGSGGRDYRIGSTGLGYGSAGNLIFYDATAGTERMRIDSSGNVGIGASPSARLSINGGAGTSQTRFEVSTTEVQEVATNAAQNAYANRLTDAAQHIWKISSTEAMRINSSGNVGIGTSSPATKLDVTSSASNIVIARSTGGFAAYQRIAPTGQAAYDFYTINGVEAARITVDGTNIMAFANGSAVTERMRIDGSGNVGIGTSSPTTRLQIAEANRADSTNFANVGIYTTTTQSTGVGGTLALGGLFNGSDLAPFGSIRGGKQNSTNGNYDGYLAFQTIANGGVLTEKMRIDSSGNVGIGCVPGYRLDVAAADTTVGIGYAARLRSNATATAAGLQFTNAAVTTENGVIYCNDAGLITVQGSAAMAFRTNGSERARISPAGGFSVGTTADPGAGAIFATGNITAYYSDDRLKTRLGSIDDALGIIDKIDAFYYEANETAKELGYEAVREVGVSAQSVQRVLPEVVAPAPIDAEYLTVRYERLVPVLIQAIKELTARVAQLEGK